MTMGANGDLIQRRISSLKRAKRKGPDGIPPTQLVVCSYSAY